MILPGFGISPQGNSQGGGAEIPANSGAKNNITVTLPISWAAFLQGTACHNYPIVPNTNIIDSVAISCTQTTVTLCVRSSTSSSSTGIRYVVFGYWRSQGGRRSNNSQSTQTFSLPISFPSGLIAASTTDDGPICRSFGVAAGAVTQITLFYPIQSSTTCWWIAIGR